MHWDWVFSGNSVENVSLHSSICLVSAAWVIPFETERLILETSLVLDGEVLLALGEEEELPCASWVVNHTSGPSQQLGKAFSSLVSLFQIYFWLFCFSFPDSSKNSVTHYMPGPLPLSCLSLDYLFHLESCFLFWLYSAHPSIEGHLKYHLPHEDFLFSPSQLCSSPVAFFFLSFN